MHPKACSIEGETEAGPVLRMGVEDVNSTPVLLGLYLLGAPLSLLNPGSLPLIKFGVFLNQIHHTLLPFFFASSFPSPPTLHFAHAL